MHNGKNTLTMNKKPMIYIISSITGRDAEVAKASAGHLKRICDILDSRGYGYFAEGMLDSNIHVGNRKFDIPKRFYDEITESVLNSVIALRLDGNRELLKKDMAMCAWTRHLMQSSVGTICYFGRSYLGGGVEIERVINAKQQCLVTFTTDGISSLINGSSSRLLTVRRYSDEKIEQYVDEFLDKVHGGLDHMIRFSVDSIMKRRIEVAAEKENEDVPGYMRKLVRRANQVV